MCGYNGLKRLEPASHSNAGGLVSATVRQLGALLDEPSVTFMKFFRDSLRS